MRLTKRKICLFLILIYILSVCSLLSQEDTNEKIPSIPLFEETISYEYAIYYLPTPSSDPEKILKKLLSTENVPLKLVSQTPKKPSTPTICGYLNKNVKKEYAPPDLESLKYYGHGITKEQSEKLQNSSQAFIMKISYNKTHMWQGLLLSNKIMESFARETEGLLWDEITREVFTPDEWHQRRVQDWESGSDIVYRHTTIHFYKNGETYRAITLGMEKFGLPDIVINNVDPAQNKSTHKLIIIYSQLLAEGAVVNSSSEYELKLSSIKHKEFRENIYNPQNNKTDSIQLLLKQGKRESGDPNNRLIEILFDKYPGKDVYAKQEKAYSSLFNKKDSVIYVKHDEELLAASNRAKAKLPVLYDIFTKGLNADEFILVKAPFKTPDDGQEWMWVEITHWDKDSIKGKLKNSPIYIPTLKEGQEVNIKQEDVFDYIFHHKDGTEEGNETSSLLEKKQKK